MKLTVDTKSEVLELLSTELQKFIQFFGEKFEITMSTFNVVETKGGFTFLGKYKDQLDVRYTCEVTLKIPGYYYAEFRYDLDREIWYGCDNINKNIEGSAEGVYMLKDKILFITRSKPEIYKDYLDNTYKVENVKTVVKTVVKENNAIDIIRIQKLENEYLDNALG